MRRDKSEPPVTDQAGPKKRSSGIVIPDRLKWHGELAAAAIYVLARSLTFTWRARFENTSAILGAGGTSPAIFCIWHNRLALCMVAYHQYVRKHHPGKGLAALISASKDGGLLARTLEHFEVQPVRGSSSRRGPQALLELSSWLDKGYHVAITPDGPRGPRYTVQGGVIALAQLTGAPIIPVSTFTRRKMSFGSWDQFQLPAPFSRSEIIFGKEFIVPREISEKGRDELRLELESRLKEMTRD